MDDYKELISHIPGDAAFRHIISECGADGKVWFDKRFICDYVSHLKYAIEQLVKERDELVTKCHGLEKERDAAVDDLKEAVAGGCELDQCRLCKYQEDDYQCHHDCIPYSDKWGWEWRGVGGG